MVLYFDSVLESPSDATTTCLSWHEQHSIISVGLSLSEGKGGIVNSYNKEGQPLHSGPLLQRSAAPTAISWHPTRKLLVVGWANGEVVIWNDDGKELHEVPRLHTTSITTITWTSSGSRLGTGDTEGIFAAWKADARGRVQHDPLYRHALLSPISDCVCKPGNAGSGDPDLSNIASLARAAVGGDETALDMFADYKKGFSSKLKLPFKRKEGLAFYVGLSNGVVHHVDEKGVKSESFRLDSSIQQLLYCQDKDYLVAVSADLQVVKCRVHGDGKVEELDRVKFGGVEGGARITWAGSGLLAVATSDPSLRLWDLNSGDNYALVLKESRGFSSKECVTSVAYCAAICTLAAATANNRVAIWKTSTLRPRDKGEPESRWILQPAISLNLPCSTIQWCHSCPILAVGGPEGASLLTEQKSRCALSSTMVAMQTGSRHVAVDVIGRKSSQTSAMSGMAAPLQQALPAASAHVEFDTDIPFKGLAVAMENLAVWDGHFVSVYEVTSSGESFIGSFPCTSLVVALHDQSIFSVEAPKDAKDKPKIQVRNFQGTVKQLLHVQDKEGLPHLVSTTDNYMVMATDAGYIRVYDLSRRDAKPHCNSKNLREVIPDLGAIVAVEVNPSGSKVAILCNKENGVPDSRVYVYDTEADKLQDFDFETGLNGMDDFADPGPKTDVEQSRDDAATDVAGRYPVTIRWDATESRLLSCEAQISNEARQKANEAGEQRSSLSMVEGTSDSSAPPVADILVVSLFTTQDHGVMLQDSFERPPSYDQLIGAKVPHFYFSKLLSSAPTPEEARKDQVPTDERVSVAKKIMRDFVGLDDCDEKARAAMLNFSYHLVIGDMDEAFKAIKLIKGVAVWESMARMCVKTRRLDVARVCLANMGHARGARALREAEEEPERDVRVARLAVELGMNEEAERLYKSCERYDLLNLFYQATGQWEKALETASQVDRVHLRTTFYKYAKHLEASGDIAGAIPNYEKSGNHYFEVPRMLFDETQMLEAYVMKSKDRKLRKWWAQYMESTGDMETALKFYKQAADPLSLVRVYCYCGNPDKAAEVANETGDRAACYHLARQFENSDDIKQAIHFFTRARAFGNAIRICKEHGFEDQLMNLALLSSPSDMVEAARYYEDRPDAVDKAVMLYHKAGHFSEALELAFESEQFAALELISQELDERTDPVLLERCADFFTEHQQHDRAVAMLVAAARYEEAISVCALHDVRMNEKLVEKLTIPKDAMDKDKRDGLLIKIADCCVKQGEYHLACQKYTQAGDKEKAMRALLKSGDTEKIVFFAGVSRTKNVYVMAANYLQSLDWRKDPEIMKNIISFYTKGRALASLAGFYDACAQVEVDEYQNYEKALGALSEAFKCLAKAKMADKHQQEDKIAEMKARIALVKKFLQTRRLFESDPDEAIKQCQGLLSEPDLDSSVRYGDVYGLLVEYHAGQEHFDKAYHLMQELRERLPSVVMSYFVNVATIEAVHRAVGAPLGRGAGLGNLANGDGHKAAEESDDEVQEEIFEAGFGF